MVDGAYLHQLQGKVMQLRLELGDIVEGIVRAVALPSNAVTRMIQSRHPKP
jgi:hypothetical protein